ncbi:hypothetical protein [Chengkuizengella marina]|uniref:hypothetical protein n=1 Tax=Chengkuizengella marina TaxID=2507566 RepID=UPI00136FB756|nr:hypothetical protein [Chengkuizengella marina]
MQIIAWSPELHNIVLEMKKHSSTDILKNSPLSFIEKGVLENVFSNRIQSKVCKDWL